MRARFRSHATPPAAEPLQRDAEYAASITTSSVSQRARSLTDILKFSDMTYALRHALRQRSYPESFCVSLSVATNRVSVRDQG